jgi:uncharacterized protein
MIDPELLAILVCPDTHQPVAVADDSLIRQVNQACREGRLKTVAGVEIKEEIESGLLRDDGKVLYAIKAGIPVMLIDEGVNIEGLVSA